MVASLSLTPWSRHTSSVVGMNCLEMSIIRGSDQTDLRPAVPLFHVHPSGWPFIAHSSMGFCWLPASISPSWNELLQGMLDQASSCFVGWIKSRHIGYVFSFRKKDSLSIPQPKRRKMNQNIFFKDHSFIMVKSTLSWINKNITKHYGFQTNTLVINESIRDQILLDL